MVEAVTVTNNSCFPVLTPIFGCVAPGGSSRPISITGLCTQFRWTLAKAGSALLEIYGLNHGLWEAKDIDDDLENEIKAKFVFG